MPPKKKAKRKKADAPPPPPKTSTGGRIKKSEVKIADDSDAVLAKCRALRESLRRAASASEENDSGDESYAEDKRQHGALDVTKNKRRTSDLKSLKSVGSLAIVEVAEMASTEVVEGIEAVAVKIARQVMSNRGFSLEVPSRAASNQIYVPELDRIVLGKKSGSRSFLNVKVREGHHSTIRYKFGGQGDSLPSSFID